MSGGPGSDLPTELRTEALFKRSIHGGTPRCPWQDDGPDGWEWLAPQHRRRGEWEDHGWHPPTRSCGFPHPLPPPDCAEPGCPTEPRTGTDRCWRHSPEEGP